MTSTTEPSAGEGRAARLRAVAAEVFGWDSLRPEQATAMEWVLDGADVLVVMPTGSGKSAVFQVPGCLLPGPVVVVSPLLALQRDQIAGLPGGDRAPDAVALNSDLTAAQERAAWEKVREGGARFVYLAPEQFANNEVVERLARARPALFVVDEAQCVSSWGHDFRPDYLRLEQAVRRVGRPPLLALTATAAPPVRREITERLGMDDPRVMVTGFDRPNIRLEASRYQDEDDRRRAVLAGPPTPCSSTAPRTPACRRSSPPAPPAGRRSRRSQTPCTTARTIRPTWRNCARTRVCPAPGSRPR
ncbi:DEAD/DEAH box helicase [Streptomyces sp. VITNK9]|uniref:DEAD/DEAH box helicase n=1 Tax=Streptomyces sp. VITNK9 TaxID=2771292 RepID=UPI00399A136E